MACIVLPTPSMTCTVRTLVLACSCIASVAAPMPAAAWQASTPEATREDTAFSGMDDVVRGLADVQSVVVLLHGRTSYEFHRDGKPETLHDTQSVAKSALAAVVGVALRQGHLPSLDVRVVDVLPELRSANADPRALAITLEHLLGMTAGFAVDDAGGTARALAPERAWARPLRSDPGQSFAYDNSVVPLISAVLEKTTGQSVAAYAREHLVAPLGMAEPSYTRGLSLRTLDMARLGQLFLQDGAWKGAALLPPAFVADATRAQSRGGPPVGLPYGLAWWVPSGSTFFASGYAGQFIWVHRPLGMVVAVTSTVSPGSQQRGQALQLIRGPLFQAAQKRTGRPGS